jgi:hypothetical protein
MFYFASQTKVEAMMQGTQDIDSNATDDDDRIDAREGARLLTDAQRDARRQFALRPPRVTAAMGPLMLGAYVALWLSTRGQHPYQGPNLGIVALVYAVVAVSFGVAAKVYQRATAGVSGPSIRQQKLEGLALGLSILGSPVIQGAMKHYGASHAIVYGVIPAACPLIVIGTTLVGIAVGKEDWPQFGAALVVIVAGIVAAFVGPSGAWLAAGIGLFVAVEGYAAATGYWPLQVR